MARPPTNGLEFLGPQPNTWSFQAPSKPHSVQALGQQPGGPRPTTLSGQALGQPPGVALCQPPGLARPLFSHLEQPGLSTTTQPSQPPGLPSLPANRLECPVSQPTAWSGHSPQPTTLELPNPSTNYLKMPGPPGQPTNITSKTKYLTDPV